MRLTTIHLDKAGEPICFELDDESAGAMQLFHLLPLLSAIRTSNSVIFIDEIDRKLHPLLSYKFVRDLIGMDGGKAESQVIFTTHNTHLLDSDLVRQDDIWFVEKRPDGSSDLYSWINWFVMPARCGTPAC